MTASLPTDPKPLAVRWIIGLAWFRLAVFALLFVLALVFLSPFESPLAQGFRVGFLERAGVDPDTYGAEQAGQVVGGALVPAILSGLLLTFIARRKLIALRIVAALLLLFSLANPLAIPLTVANLVLAFRRSTKEYCRSEAVKLADALSSPGSL